ncbi:hypothetical protein [Janthinobacterium sp. LB3P112]|uniref:hypothetical protein n=1 Tax=Janthinobacterium sp. LB3P112 TaxID=3424196 RepID=UPI003F25EB51
MATKSELKALSARALQIMEPPAYESKTDVLVTGEPLSKPVYWKGRQWAVTSYGIEARDGKYVIEGSKVWEDDGHGQIKHMAEKEWVDLSDFVEALRLARSRWPKSGLAES